jgi:hypothetical protein
MGKAQTSYKLYDFDTKSFEEEENKSEAQSEKKEESKLEQLGE